MDIEKLQKKKPNDINNIHAAHRARLKRRFRKENLDNFDPHVVLELLLYFGIPVKDTNPLAHTLINKFGNIAGVLEASYEDLLKVKGVGNHTATLIKLIPALFRYYEMEKVNDDMILDTVEKIGRFMAAKFRGRTNERMYLLCFDQKYKLIYCECMAEGTIDYTPIVLRHIIEAVMRVNAYSVVLCHNHPQGFAIPSAPDLLITQAIRKNLRQLKVHFRDHLIFCVDDYISMMESGFLMDFDYEPD